MTLEPVNNYVVLKMVEPKAPKLFLPTEKETAVRWGEVVAVGPGVPDLYGVRVPPPLTPGDMVYVMRHGLEEIDLTGLGAEEKAYVISELDILARATEIKEDDVTIEPLGNYVEIEKVEALDRSSGGIYLPDSKKYPPNVGTVVSVGKGWRAADGSPIEMQVKPGDQVVFLPFNTLVVDLAHLGIDKKRYLVSHGDICCVIKGVKNE